jgi:hypothetical protein
MTDRNPLPDGFADLEPFLADWGELHTQEERYQRRQQLPFEALEAFHAAAAPRLAAVFAHLDSFPFGQLPEREARLRRLILGLTEAAQAVEIFGQSRVPHARDGHSVAIGGVPVAENGGV